MAAITYTAKRKLASGHTAGNSYAFNIGLTQWDRSTKRSATRHRAIGGNAETWLQNLETCFDVTVEASDEFEAERTNLLAYSEDFFSAPWNKTRVTVTTNASIAPDGSMTADKQCPTTEINSHYSDQLVAALGENETCSASVYVKRGEYPRVDLSVIVRNGSGPHIAINCDDGRVFQTSQGAGQSGIQYDAEAVGNGWYRLKIHGLSTTAGGTTPRLRVYAVEHQGLWAGTWSKNALTVAKGAIATPKVDWTADSLIETTAATTAHYCGQTAYLIAGRLYRGHVYLKALGSGAQRWGSIVLTAGSVFSQNQTLVINLTTGAITAQAGANWGEVVVSDAGSGWWRVDFATTAGFTGTSTYQIRLSNTATDGVPSYTGDGASGMYVCAPYLWSDQLDNTTGVFGAIATNSEVAPNGTDGIYIWGAQLERGATVTEYIQSPGATATLNPARVAKLREFLASVADGSPFTIDPFGTVAVPVAPIACELDSDSWKETRQGSRFLKFSFRAREL